MLTALIKVFLLILIHELFLFRFNLFLYAAMTTNKKTKTGKLSVVSNCFVHTKVWLKTFFKSFNGGCGNICLKVLHKRITPMRYLYTVLYLIIEIPCYILSKHLKNNVERKPVIFKQNNNNALLTHLGKQTLMQDIFAQKKSWKIRPQLLDTN